jgi:hypothetical protein
MVVISTMLVVAWSSGHLVAAGAALSFVISDSTIARDRFVEPWAAAPVFIMVTYHLAQAGFVVSLLR